MKIYLAYLFVFEKDLNFATSSFIQSGFDEKSIETISALDLMRIHWSMHVTCSGFDIESVS